MGINGGDVRRGRVLHRMPCDGELRIRGRLGTGEESLAWALDLRVRSELTCERFLRTLANHAQGEGTGLA